MWAIRRTPAIPSGYAPPRPAVWPRLRVRMARYIPEEIEAYSERYTSAQADLFDRLDAETRETQQAPQMMVGHVEGAFLAFLVAMTNAKRVVEGGTFTGWASTPMARGLSP